MQDFSAIFIPAIFSIKFLAIFRVLVMRQRPLVRRENVEQTFIKPRVEDNTALQTKMYQQIYNTIIPNVISTKNAILLR